MSLLDNAIDISKLSQGKLVVIYGKSASGKTLTGSTFPKPMLYIRVGDDGYNTIKDVRGIKAVQIQSVGELKKYAKELQDNKEYKSVFVDTFTMVINEWMDENIVQKKKKMTQQSWGDLNTEVQDIIRNFHKVSQKGKWVILSGHEVTDTIEGMEDELLPDVRVAVNKGARTYLEGMANIGIHTLKIEKTITNKKTGEDKDVVKFAADIGANPYYWTKLQVSPSVKVPKRLINPTYKKIMKLVTPE